MLITIICSNSEIFNQRSKLKFNRLNLIYALILGKEFTNRGHTVKYISSDINISLFEKTDAFINTENKSEMYNNKQIINRLMELSNGKVFAINEIAEQIQMESKLFYIYAKNERNIKSTRLRKSSWGCYNKMIKEVDNGNKIIILIDHSYYGECKSTIRSDKTQLILDSAYKWAKQMNGKIDGKDIVINHIFNYQIKKIYPSDDITQSEKFIRKTALDFHDIYKYYNESDIFVSTHRESFGLSPIECSGSGTLVASKDKDLNDCIKNNLHHYQIEDVNNINWTEMVGKIDKKKAIECSKIFSYDILIDDILDEISK